MVSNTLTNPAAQNAPMATVAATAEPTNCLLLPTGNADRNGIVRRNPRKKLAWAAAAMAEGEETDKEARMSVE